MDEIGLVNPTPKSHIFAHSALEVRQSKGGRYLAPGRDKLIDLNGKTRIQG